LKILRIETAAQAQQASAFLSTANAFEDSKDWNATEVRHLTQSPFKALSDETYHCWMIIENDQVIGYIDLREHDLHNGGYYTDWFVVHKDYRSRGLGGELLQFVENYAKLIKEARYILVETGDIEMYARTCKFYETHGYIQVGHIPEYYYPNWGMYVYQKLL
jgi:GNAT superfamily N-acetyltransferase